MTFTTPTHSFHPFRVTQSPYYKTANSHRSHVFSSRQPAPTGYSPKHPFTHAPFTHPHTHTPTMPPNKRGSLDLLSEHRICQLMDVALHMSQAISPSRSPFHHPRCLPLPLPPLPPFAITLPSTEIHFNSLLVQRPVSWLFPFPRFFMSFVMLCYSHEWIMCVPGHCRGSQRAVSEHNRDS